MIEPAKVFHSLQEAGDCLSRDWVIPADLPYFEGHFPGNPIFPAVGIVDASICVLSSVLSDPGLTAPVILVAKFTHPLVPGDQVRIDCKNLNGREWSVEWIKGSAKPYASLRIEVGT